MLFTSFLIQKSADFPTLSSAHTLFGRTTIFLSAVYAYGGNILSIDGRTLAELDLAENEYVYDLVYSQDGTVLTVAIVSNEETERIVRLTLPIQDEIDDLRGDAEKKPLDEASCGSSPQCTGFGGCRLLRARQARQQSVRRPRHRCEIR